MDLLKKKYKRLKELLNELGSGVVAFSGGVDSGLLTKVSFDCLGKNVLAVTAQSATFGSLELNEAKRIAKEIGVKHTIIKTEEFKDENFINNPLNRCYWCKRELFSMLKEIASKYKFKYILDGTNYDDRKDSRPGLEANREYAVKSPLYQCRFSKNDIKKLAKLLGLSFADKPTGTCLSSRISFGEKITLKKLKRIEKAEGILKDFFGQNTLIRARDHQDILRIELGQSIWTKVKEFDINKVVKKLKNTGYKYITLDLEGYIPAGKR